MKPEEEDGEPVTDEAEVETALHGGKTEHEPWKEALTSTSTQVATAAAAKTFSLDDVQGALKGSSPKLIEEIHGHIQAQYESEEDRAKALDVKATSLLTVTGLSLTVAFSFGASVLLKERDSFRGIGWGYDVLVFVFVAALASGIFAGWMALRSLQIEKFKAPSLAEMMRGDVLSGARKIDLKFPNQAGDAGLAKYRRFVAAHVWLVTERNTAALDRKASTILFGQRAFVIFLWLVLLMAAACGWAALTKPLQVVPASSSQEPRTVGRSDLVPTAAPAPPPATTVGPANLTDGTTKPKAEE